MDKPWPETICICLRPAAKIICTNKLCGYFNEGRVRRQCPSHTKVTFLLDLVQCPWCTKECVEIDPDTGSPAMAVYKPSPEMDRIRFRPLLTRLARAGIHKKSSETQTHGQQSANNSSDGSSTSNHNNSKP